MSILHDITHLLLPRRCPVCQRRLEYTEQSLCAVCASCLPRLWLPGIDDNDMLRHLWTRVPVEHAFSLVAYRHNSPFHQLLMRIKYQSDTALAYRLGWWAGSEAVRAGLDEYADVLVPVPLTARRLRERGYNQARLLADGMGRAMGVPVMELLVRQQQGTSQTHLSGEGRAQNTTRIYHARLPEALRGGQGGAGGRRDDHGIHPGPMCRGHPRGRPLCPREPAHPGLCGGVREVPDGSREARPDGRKVFCSALRWPVQRASSGIAARCDGACTALHLSSRFSSPTPACRCLFPHHSPAQALPYAWTCM